MATLTYNPTDPTQPEFSEQEQADIALGEQMEQEQAQLLAGKYRDAEELEQAYIQLQQKLGEPEQEEAEYEEEGEEEYEEEEGEEEEVEEIEQYQLTDDDVEAIHAMVGGEEEYNQMISWAGENLSSTEVEIYDYVMDLGDPYAIFFAVRSLQNSYSNAVGYEGEMLTGSAPSNPVDAFRSQAEVVAAMNDPRYDNDPAYRQDVYDKLERSPIEF